MDLDTKPGSKISFNDIHGYEIERNTFKTRFGATKGSIFTVRYVEVGCYNSLVYIDEFGGRGFNTVMFDNVL